MYCIFMRQLYPIHNNTYMVCMIRSTQDKCTCKILQLGSTRTCKFQSLHFFQSPLIFAAKDITVKFPVRKCPSMMLKINLFLILKNNRHHFKIIIKFIFDKMFEEFVSYPYTKYEFHFFSKIDLQYIEIVSMERCLHL